MPFLSASGVSVLNLHDLFGGARAQILDAMLRKPTLPWSQRALAKAADVDERTVRRVAARLAALGIVTIEMRFSAGKVITLNRDTQPVRALEALYAAVTARR